MTGGVRVDKISRVAGGNKASGVARGSRIGKSV